MSKQRLIDADVLMKTYKGWLSQLESDEDAGDRNGVEMCIAVLEDAPTVTAITMDWLDAKIRGYASALKSTELKALVLVKQMWEKEQEAR